MKRQRLLSLLRPQVGFSLAPLKRWPLRRGLRRGWRAVPVCVRAYLPIAAMLLVVYALIERQWYDAAPEGDPLYGANFSCKRAQYFGMDCRQALTSVLDDLGARSVRLSIYWSDVEPEPEQYDFSSIDWQLDLVQSRGARAVVTVGMKAQRFPEYWLPTWLRLAANIPPNAWPEDNPLIQRYLFPYLDAATRHVAGHPAVEAIQVENEPFVHYKGHANGWHMRPSWLAREVATVRAALGEVAAAPPAGGATARTLPAESTVGSGDGSARLPRIVVNHASWLRRDMTWKWILNEADVLSQSVYTKRQRGPWPWLYIFPYRLGPVTPYLPGQAREAARRGKELWIGELQAEPYEQPTVDVRRQSTAAAASFSTRWLRDNITLARRSGATRVYFWGVEWWAYLRTQRGDSALWDLGRELFAKSGDGQNASR